MAKNNLLDTSTVTFSEIVSNGKKYQVPIYQRDYSWREENWEDLWTDILSIISHEIPNHYMGSIVLQRQEDKRFAIIDGQQRIATLSIIALATLKNIQDLIDKGIETQNNEERKKLLMDSFLGVKDAVSLKYSSKLFLNTNNNDFYQTWLLQLKEPSNKSQLNDSEKLLLKAYNFYYDKIKERVSASSAGEKLAIFLKDEVAEKLIFIQIIVEHEVNAYTVFETLNARGESLTVTDLLKNYFFSLIPSPSDLELAQKQWNKITELIGLDSFPQFLRHYWNSRNTLIRQEGLFKAVKKFITDAEKVFELLDNLEKTSEIYIALSDSTSDFWDAFSNKEVCCERVEELILFSAKQCYPLLIAAYEKLLKDEFAKVLKICSIISFRRTVIGEKNPNQLERAYNQAAQKVFHQNIKNVQSIFQSLQEVYLADAEFKKDFAAKEIKSSGKTKKLLQYILRKLEEHIAPIKQVDWGEKVTIEHILPENPSPEWLQSFDSKNIKKLVHRLGNQTLLEKSYNKQCRSLPFSEKREIYKKSNYEVTKELTNSQDWNQKNIEDRQRELSSRAASIWRLDF